MLLDLKCYWKWAVFRMDSDCKLSSTIAPFELKYTVRAITRLTGYMISSKLSDWFTQNQNNALAAKGLSSRGMESEDKPFGVGFASLAVLDYEYSAVFDFHSDTIVKKAKNAACEETELTRALACFARVTILPVFQFGTS